MTTPTPGTVVLTATERVTFGQPAAEAIAAEAATLGASRVMLIASKSLKENTDEIDRIESALGDRHAGTFTGVAPHVPRGDVIAAADMARDCGADLLFRLVADRSLTAPPSCRSVCRMTSVPSRRWMPITSPSMTRVRW